VTEQTLGMGVIGCGGIAHAAHLPNIVKNPRARLVAVADIDRDRANATAEQWGCAGYGDYQELLANPEVDAVCVTSWAAAHAESVIAAAEAGKHILCEKPIAIKLEDADAMVAAADRAGVKFTMGYQTRFGVGAPLVKQILDDGLIGKVMGLNVVGVGPSSHGAPWFLKRELSGGGVLMDWGIYTAFNLNWWLGPVERVFATSAIFRKEVMVRGELLTDLDVEDTVAAHLTFRSGAMGSWYSAWAVKTGHSTTSIDGSEGSILMGKGEGVNLYSTQLGDPDHLRGWRTIPAVEPSLITLHYRKIEHLVDAVLDDKPLVMTGADGRDALELVLAIYRSAELGQPVTLPLERGAPVVEPAVAI